MYIGKEKNDIRILYRSSAVVVVIVTSSLSLTMM